MNLSRVFENLLQRTIAAKHVICKQVEKETRLKEFKISNALNETIWSKGRYSSPRKIVVKLLKIRTLQG